MRLAQGQVRGVVADRAFHPGQIAAGQGCREVGAGDEGDDADGQARHPGPGTGGAPMSTRELSRSMTGVTPAAQDRVLLFTRVFNAPRSVVFRAWADPKQLVKWYAPQGFTVAFLEWTSAPAGPGANACVRRTGSITGAMAAISKSSNRSAWCSPTFLTIRKAIRNTKQS